MVTATATPLSGPDSGSTSEFSACRTAVAAGGGGGGGGGGAAQPANLSVAFSASPAKVEPGNDLTLRGTVTNNGPGSAPGSELTFSFPTSADVKSLPAGCAQDGPGSVTCSLGTLADGQSATRRSW